jgi:G3E family GTPase
MKTTIVCGVLGSGKTTFLRNILRKGAVKTVVLVNEFGSAGIDGEIIAAGGIETVELPSGCVCCTLRFDLISTVQKIIDRFQPEHLFIEPSGVAAPSSVIEALETLKVGPISVIGIVDAVEFLEDYERELYGWFFKNQITRSDIILVNKTDLSDEQKTRETVRVIGTLNQNALIIPAVNAVIDPSLLQHKSKPPHKEYSPDHSLRVETVTVRLDRPPGTEYMKQVLEKLAGGEYGEVLRAKALVQTEQGAFRFDLASKHISVEPFDRRVEDSRLVIIGTGLLEDEIRNLIT